MTLGTVENRTVQQTADPMTDSLSLRKKLALAALTLLLGACQSLAPDTGLKVERQAWEHLKPGCLGESCPLVNIDVVHFPDAPALESLVTRRLLQMTQDAPGTPLPASLASYERDFLARAEPGWASYLQAKVREQHDQLTIIELSSYLATGGAHGMPGRGLITYDRKREQALTLRDMLLPGQEEAFWKLAEAAHKRWLAANKLDQDADFASTWPFQRTEHVALTRGAMLLKYDVYSIAPYASGHPEPTIPYPQLNGILKPEYFPGRG